MKVYVDELPKTCAKCGLCSHIFANCLPNLYKCAVDGHTRFAEYKVEDEKPCPLQSLADYTKQVRKEVREEIKSAIKEKLTYPDNRVDCPFDNGYPDEDTICSVLDQIQGENCCYGKI